MKNKTPRIFIGAALVLIGALVLLSQLLHFDLTEIIIGGMFLLGGIVFFYVYVHNNENWWALIPGFTLAGIGGLIGMGAWFPKLADAIGGTFFLAMIGLSFLLIYLTHRDFWWAIIPAGTLFTLALVALAANLDGFLAGGVLFLGIAATFAVLGLMPIGRKEKWPWIPAGICAVMGALITLGSNTMMNSFLKYFWPAALLLAGIVLILRSFRKQ